MFIIMVASECAPVAKVGGLADVVFGLSRELEIRGNAVEIILPKYDCMRYDHIWGLQVAYEDLWVPWYGGAIHCSVWFGFVHGRKCFFIEPHSGERFFERGGYYGSPDDPLRFAFFSKAALEFILQSNKRPEVIHCHDWATGMLPVMQFEQYAHIGMPEQRVCYTIHNFKHQGVTGIESLWATGLGRPEFFMVPERLADDVNHGALNMMKAGVVYSNFVTTVSPKHAWEACFTEQGHGLGHALHVHEAKFGGVLNGLEYDHWNPSKDPYIPHHYDVDNPDDKYRNKEALRDRLWLNKGYNPIVAYVGRLDAQKGVHLVRHGIFHALDRGAQFVLLGTGPDHGINEEFWQLKHHLNDSPEIHLEIGFDEELAHLIYAGADIIIQPSMFEPCGLTQLIGLRYGTVPVVRSVGGLADTVFDWHHDGRPREARNGFVFHDADAPGLDSALSRAIGLWFDFPDEFRELMLNGMRYDYSWRQPGQDYMNIYHLIEHK